MRGGVAEEFELVAGADVETFYRAAGFLFGQEEVAVVLLEVGGGGEGVGVVGPGAIDEAMDGDDGGDVRDSGGNVAFGIGWRVRGHAAYVVGVDVGEEEGVDAVEAGELEAALGVAADPLPGTVGGGGSGVGEVAVGAVEGSGVDHHGG